MNALILSDVAIRQDSDGRFNLNDLHKAAGRQAKHRPNQFIRLAQTKALMDEIQCADSRSASAIINGGPNRGTYVVRELVLAYATWISPAFFLRVLRTFDAVTQPQPSLPPPQTPADGIPYGTRLLLRFEGDGRYTASQVPSDAHILTLAEYRELAYRAGQALVPLAVYRALKAAFTRLEN